MDWYQSGKYALIKLHNIITVLTSAPGSVSTYITLEGDAQEIRHFQMHMNAAFSL